MIDPNYDVTEHLERLAVRLAQEAEQTREKLARLEDELRAVTTARFRLGMRARPRLVEKVEAARAIGRFVQDVSR